MNLKEAMEKITKDQKLTEQFMAATEAGIDETVAFFHGLGCEVTKEELTKAMNELSQDREMSKEEIAFVSGGSKSGAKEFFKCCGIFCWGFMEGTHT